VETGSTLKATGLQEIDTILESEAIIICNKESKHRNLAEKISRRIAGIVIAQKHVMIEYDIPRHLLDEAQKITPGHVSPTVAPLLDPNCLAVRVLLKKCDENDALDKLEALGAVAIVVTNVNNVRT
jgi:ATP phosphoribosyltransferase